AAGNPNAGKTLYAVCVGCHGDKAAGNTALNAPALAGQEEWYVVRQLNNFKAGIRGAHAQDTYGAQMRPMAMTLANDQAVNDVAAYISSLVPADSPATVKGDIAGGKAKFALCAGCHGPNGEGNQAVNAPRLTGQHDWYVVRQLQNFRAGIRGAHPQDSTGAQMRPMSQALASEQELINVASYVNTLK
ncbi:MAG: c-type cytochrome, partial [SAR324 cluster bacterium]|nr:c-type cytochrome [SAR324 cluster bacterium]